MKYLLLFFSAIIYISTGYSQEINRHSPDSQYIVGYKSIRVIDSGRVYKPYTGVKNKFYYRPIEMDIWYPAVHPELNSEIQYGEFLNLLEQRSNRFQDDTVFKSLTAELVQYLCINLKITDTSGLIHLKTASYLHAGAVQQRFPLIVYMSAYNGMSYENLNLFEWLAGHGYVVVCIESVGRYPGNMSTNPADIMEQVNDASFVISYLRTASNIDTSKIGVIGYSWGGLASLILGMNNNQPKAILSLDGSEMHYYGESKQEDRDFDELRRSVFFNLGKVSVPYTYLESGFKQSDREVDSIFNVLPSLNLPKKYARFPKATHEDFSCLPSLPTQMSGIKNNGSYLYKQFCEFSLNYFNQCLKGQEEGLLRQLSRLYEQHIGDSLYPKLNPVINGLVIKGRICDSKNGESLAYVNVGIQDKNIGTVTRHDGRFVIYVSPELSADSLKISMAGYQGQILSISDILKQPGPVVIRLKEKISVLREVVITAKALHSETKGNTTTSNFISVGLPLKFLGSETGIKIKLGKKPVLLKSFSFNISENRLDTAVFRMNIYNFRNGIPFENILQQNILVPVGKQKGLYTINLTDYKLVMKGDILISLEWIEGSSSARENGAIFLSAGFLNSATWHRLTSQGKWKKASGLGVGFNAEIQQLKM